MTLRLSVVSEHGIRLGQNSTKVFGVHGGTIVLAVSKPLDCGLIQNMKWAYDRDFETVAADADQIRAAIRRLYARHYG